MELIDRNGVMSEGRTKKFAPGVGYVLRFLIAEACWAGFVSASLISFVVFIWFVRLVSLFGIWFAMLFAVCFLFVCGFIVTFFLHSLLRFGRC